MKPAVHPRFFVTTMLALAIVSPCAAQQPDEPPAPTDGRNGSEPEIVVQEQPMGVTVEQPAPQIRVQQIAPKVIVQQPAPDVTLERAEPQIEIETAEPTIDVREAQGRPRVIVHPAEPVVRIEEAEPQVTIRTAEPSVTVENAGGEPTIRIDQLSGQQALLALADLSVADLIGRPVHGTGGERVGEVADLLVVGDGQEIEVVIVETGGFLGFGERRVGVPWSQAGFDPADRVVTIEMTEAEFDAAPEFEYSGTENALIGPSD